MLTEKIPLTTTNNISTSPSGTFQLYTGETGNLYFSPSIINIMEGTSTDVEVYLTGIN